jgi:hypothetical protein
MTCPVVFASFHFHFGIKLYRVLLANAATYGLFGLAVESLRQQLNHAKYFKVAQCPWFCTCGAPVEHVRHRECLPIVPSSVDLDLMPLVPRMVAAFRVVCGVIAHGESWDLLLARLHILSWPKP